MAFIYDGFLVPDDNNEVFLAEIFMRRARILEEDVLLTALAEQFAASPGLFCFATDPEFWSRRDELQADLAAQMGSFGEHLGLELIPHDVEGKRSEVELRQRRVGETVEEQIEQRLAVDRLAYWFEHRGWGHRSFVVTHGGERVYVSDGDFWTRRDAVLEELMAVRDAA